VIKTLTAGMYYEFNGGPPPSTIKGVASVSNGTVTAVCGVTLINGEYFIVFDAKPETSKRDIIKGWNIFKETLDSDKAYYALADRDFKTAPSLLAHFNFVHLMDDIYFYRGE